MIKEKQIYGNWEDTSTLGDKMVDHGKMQITSRQLLQSWQRCSLSADFWARYMALSSPEVKVEPPVRPDAVESALSYVLNELFENAAKFSGGPLDELIFEFWLFPERIALQVTNHIEPSSQDNFIYIIEEILGGDLEKLYFQRLEDGAEADRKGSGLGYLSIMNDYKVRFGFRFTPVGEESIAVDVQAHIRLKEI